MSRCNNGCDDTLQQVFLRESRENCSGIEPKLNKLLANDTIIISELDEIEKTDKKILHEVEEIEKTDKKILHEVEEIEERLEEISEMFDCCKIKVSGPFISEHSELEVTCFNDSNKKKEIEVNVYDLDFCPRKLIKFEERCDKDIDLCPYCTKTVKFKAKHDDCDHYSLKDKLLEIEVVCKNGVDDILVLSRTKSSEHHEKFDNVLLNFAYKCL